MLCKCCQNIFDDQLMPKEDVPQLHHLTKQEFIESAQQGCQICSSLWFGYTREEQATILSSEISDSLSCAEDVLLDEDMKGFTQYEIESSPLFRHSSRTFRFHFRERFYGYEAEFLLQPLAASMSHHNSKCIALIQDEGPQYRRRDYEFSLNTGSSICSQLITHWMTECSNNHVTCECSVDQAWHPSRLLDIGLETDSIIHLCITHEQHPEGRYAALSHCWGTTSILCLTTANFDHMRSGIHPSDLPRSFQDAITVAQRLQIRYLWIDSLCILQDSVVDWRQESAMMGDVYKNAICCIAATAASDGGGGLFRDRERSLVEISRVQSSWTRQPNQLYELMDLHFWELNVDHAPLSRRGWAVQERELAPRVLHFCENQLLWQCGELYACESYPKGLPLALQSSGNIERDIDGTESERAYSDWQRLVRYYSSCSLTKQGDKLIAISGLAKVVQQRTGDRYLAGLWERSLPGHLLWWVYRDQEPSVSNSMVYRQQQEYISPPSVLPCQPYRAPSWSWAALDSPIHQAPIHADDIYLIDILKANVTPLGTDPTGQLSDGSVRLRGTLAKVEIEELDLYIGKVKAGKVNSHEWGDIDGYLYLDEFQQVLPVPLYLMPVRDKSGHKPEEFVIEGLLIHPAREVQGTYRRLGYFEANGEEAHQALNLAENHIDRGRQLYDTQEAGVITLV